MRDVDVDRYVSYFSLSVFGIMYSNHPHRALCWLTWLLTMIYAFNQVQLLALLMGDLPSYQQVQVLASADRPVKLHTQAASSSVHPVVVDILSIGSQRRGRYLETQRRILGTHASVRHFFNATELDDVDSRCDTRLTTKDVHRIRAFCQSRSDTSALLSKWKRFFAPPSILREKANPAGWLCAQPRPAVGLHRVLTHYQTADEEFPDYLILQDDDTYWNLDRLVGLLGNKSSSSSEEPTAWAGCLFRLPQLWLPHGGFGLVLNRALLDKLTSPMSPDDLDRMRDDLGEQQWMQPNTTMIDLIYSYVTAQHLTAYHKNWKQGFCVHSDW
jgi:hypothetical protein